MKNNGRIEKLRQWIQDNFFGLIIVLVVVLLIILITSLFVPIGVSHLPDASLQLEKYSAAVEQRTIIIRSISYIISGISVIIAFVSLLQNKNSELKRERLQVMPFPAYTIPLENIQYSNTTSSELQLKKEHTNTDTSVEAEFNIMVKNIGLGSLVDFEIKEAYYHKSNGELHYLDISFLTNFILGKQETVQVIVNLITAFSDDEESGPQNLNSISFIASFNDLLGYRYEQEFTIQSDIYSFGKEEFTKSDDSKKEYTTYTLKPQQVTHTHPYEQ